QTTKITALIRLHPRETLHPPPDLRERFVLRFLIGHHVLDLVPMHCVVQLLQVFGTHGYAAKRTCQQRQTKKQHSQLSLDRHSSSRSRDGARLQLNSIVGLSYWLWNSGKRRSAG